MAVIRRVTHPGSIDMVRFHMSSGWKLRERQKLFLFRWEYLYFCAQEFDQSLTVVKEQTEKLAFGTCCNSGCRGREIRD